jgi:glycine/D-amino acid oxidase-like deaminating enzyme
MQRGEGAKVFTSCAVNAIETSAGRVSAVITEKGRACDAVLLAGGAWSRNFAKRLGITLLQLRVRSSAQRTAPLEGGPETAAWIRGVAYRRRLDGGYTVASTGADIADIEPDNFRFFLQFLPALKMQWRHLRLSFGKQFFTALSASRPWVPGTPSVYEETRVLDPEPAREINRLAMERISEIYPVFEKARVVQEWSGFIDVTPDAVPVISPVDEVPGFFIATGFSGHGFGIGPAAGRLAADLVTGDRPIVDPYHFRFSRFSDGSNPLPEAGL